MNERISALMDGELDDEAAALVIKNLPGDDEYRQRWSEYHLIGDALRKNGHLDTDVSARVMEALLEEPVVLAPRRVRARPLLQNMLALAASVAGVAVVSTVLWQGRAGQVLEVAEVTVPVDAQVPAELQAYLVAHQTHAPASTMHGASHYLKAVALETAAVSEQ